MFKENDFSFQFPEAAWMFILALPLLIGFLSLSRYRRRQMLLFAEPEALKIILVPRSATLTKLRFCGWILIWFFGCLTLMQPIGNIRYTPLSEGKNTSSIEFTETPQNIILLVDTSASMHVIDAPQNKTRLDEAKNILANIVRQLRGQTVSLYSFTSKLNVIVPPTLDYLFLRLSIEDINTEPENNQGTDFLETLRQLKEIEFSQLTNQQTFIILLSDGGDMKLEQEKEDLHENRKNLILTALPDPKEFDFHLYSIGLGQKKASIIPRVTFKGKPVFSGLEPNLLIELGRRNRGEYFTGNEWTSWDLAKEIIHKIKQSHLNESRNAQQRKVVAVRESDIEFDLYFQIPLAICLILYAINWLIPEVKKP